MAKKKKASRMNDIHLVTLLKRYTRQIVTNRSTMLAYILQAPVMLLIIALTYEKNSFIDPTKFWAANTVVFLLIMISCFMGILNSYREITKERLILSREISGGLDAVSYVTSKFIVLTVVGLLQCLVLVGGSMIFIDFGFSFPVVKIPLCFLSVFLVNLASTSLGLLISAIIKKGESAVLPILLVIICMMVFSGALFDFGGAATYIQYVVPAYWGISLLGNTAGLSFRSVYEHQISISIVVLIVFILLCYFLTITIIRGKNRRKNN